MNLILKLIITSVFVGLFSFASNANALKKVAATDQLQTTSATVEITTEQPQLQTGVFDVFKAEENERIGNLPTFMIYRGTGERIWYKTGFNEAFFSEMEQALANNKEDSHRIETDLALVSPKLNKPRSDREFIFVEYWAEWCIPCKWQKTEVTKWLSQQKPDTYAWYYIENDVLRVSLSNDEWQDMVDQLRKKPMEYNGERFYIMLDTAEKEDFIYRYIRKNMSAEDQQQLKLLYESAKAKGETKPVKSPENKKTDSPNIAQ